MQGKTVRMIFSLDSNELFGIPFIYVISINKPWNFSKYLHDSGFTKHLYNNELPCLYLLIQLNSNTFGNNEVRNRIEKY